MSKAKKVTSIVVASIFAVLGIVMILWYFGGSYGSFYAKTNKEFEIAGLNDGFIPQGITFDEQTETFLTSGYMKDGSASRIYVVNAKTGATTKFFTLKDGEASYTGHAGGIATDGTSVWVAGEGKVVRFDFAQIETVENGGSIQIVDAFESGNGADFVTVEGNNLWVGEFQRDGSYDTDETHFVETSDGKTNKALSFCYEIDNAQTYGLTSTTPTKALSTPSLVQGMVVSQDKIVLSTSYSLPDSHIYTYNNILNGAAEKTFDFNGTPIDLYVLESEDLTDDLTAPCMSEEIVLADGKVYILFESACQKYNFATREQLRNVYSFVL